MTKERRAQASVFREQVEHGRRDLGVGTVIESQRHLRLIVAAAADQGSIQDRGVRTEDAVRHQQCVCSQRHAQACGTCRKPWPSRGLQRHWPAQEFVGLDTGSTAQVFQRVVGGDAP